MILIASDDSLTIKINPIDELGRLITDIVDVYIRFWHEGSKATEKKMLLNVDPEYTYKYTFLPEEVSTLGTMFCDMRIVTTDGQNVSSQDSFLIGIENHG